MWCSCSAPQGGAPGATTRRWCLATAPSLLCLTRGLDDSLDALEAQWGALRGPAEGRSGRGNKSRAAPPGGVRGGLPKPLPKLADDGPLLRLPLPLGPRKTAWELLRPVPKQLQRGGQLQGPVPLLHVPKDLHEDSADGHRGVPPHVLHVQRLELQQPLHCALHAHPPHLHVPQLQLRGVVHLRGREDARLLPRGVALHVLLHLAQQQLGCTLFPQQLYPRLGQVPAQRPHPGPPAVHAAVLLLRLRHDLQEVRFLCLLLALPLHGLGLVLGLRYAHGRLHLTLGAPRGGGGSRGAGRGGASLPRAGAQEGRGKNGRRRLGGLGGAPLRGRGARRRPRASVTGQSRPPFVQHLHDVERELWVRVSLCHAHELRHTGLPEQLRQHAGVGGRLGPHQLLEVREGGQGGGPLRCCIVERCVDGGDGISKPLRPLQLHQLM
mmetsp:Transcript_15770/g.49572  ORF Transcript_15770/g.49572 Transcript_15770/m.49572 type:complete len:437 (+) Transcript_15770:290-1600(+)